MQTSIMIESVNAASERIYWHENGGGFTNSKPHAMRFDSKESAENYRKATLPEPGKAWVVKQQHL